MDPEVQREAHALLADGARVLELPVRHECADFLSDLPEPPRTLRAGDLRDDAARVRLQQGRSLLARLWVLREQGAGGVPVLERAVAAAVKLHACAAEGRLSDAELAWVEARREAQVALSPFRLWEPARRERAAFDRARDRSRFDPADAVDVELKLECPSPDCARLGRFRPERDPEPQRLRCSTCGTRFLAWFVEALARPRALPGELRFSARTCDGQAVDVSLPDEDEAALAVAPGDLLAFLGRRVGRWEAVENLATGGRARARGGGPCFLATAAFGAEAPELEAFRDFRDRILLPHRAGRRLVALYYRTGPWLAGALEHSPALRGLLRGVLQRLHRGLTTRGYGSR